MADQENPIPVPAEELDDDVKAELAEAAKKVTAAVPIPKGKVRGEVAAEDLESTDEAIRAALAALQEKAAEAVDGDNGQS